MRTPHKCPICNGRGIVSNGFYSATEECWSTTSADPEKCRSCSGQGVVWDEQDQFSWPVYDMPSVTITY